MATYTISSSSQLKAILSAAKSGDTIKLAAGVYSDVSVLNKTGLTITSADPNNPATITGLRITGGDDITISKLNLAGTSTTAQNSFQVRSSNNIVFDNLKVSGPAGHDISTLENAGLMIRASTNVSITNSEFSGFRYGLSLLDNENVKVAGNFFHEIRTDGVRGGGNDFLTITGNVFTDFFPAEGDHADAIQLWTNNTSKATHDVTISNNLIVRGDGEPTQGIFLRDTGNTLPFEKVAITGNMVIGALYNGISVQGMVNSTVSGNTVLGFDDQASWLRLSAVSSTVVTNNNATKFVWSDTDALITDNNIRRLSVLDGGAGAVSQWMASQGSFGGKWGDNPDSMLDRLDLNLNKYSFLRDDQRTVVIEGTAGSDRLTVSAVGNSRVEAGDGNDTIYGGGNGNNALHGGKGDDVYFVRSVKDKVIEQADGGIDTIATSINLEMANHVENLRVEGEDLTVSGNDLANRMTGSDGIDTFYGMGGADTLLGLDGDDFLSGGDGNDNLNGGDGADVLYGDAGNDTLVGGDGNDLILGGAGNDLIQGGSGANTLTGGLGADEFRFRQGDLSNGVINVITDFQRGVDKISLALIDANSRTSANEAFRFIGSNAFNGRAGDLRFYKDGADVIVQADLNGDGRADFAIKLLAVSALSASDFHL
ncbi:right-handed parallel beta-helix repeat-containing protein [Novosphingobium sp.]|uniref:right-handed parallel beta-helix repeat-containing protein n=1 Tax=Novosphingobium sp. TaxID=1874826 RepID=UPI0026315E95|nr:right-handed parallel beta-helix repeat-containing protein [Novosphingobium sp.]